MVKNDIKLRVVFMGTSNLSEVILSSLIEKSYNVVGVFTKPDTKIGRKHEQHSPAVKLTAEKHRIPVFQPSRFRDEAIEQLRQLKPDLVVVAAYGKIIPKAALEIPGFGFINVHVSLLPKFRGPSPVQNALLSGENETGTTIMLMDEGIDTGAILAQETLAIEKDDNTHTLMEKLAKQGAKLLLETLPKWIEREIQPITQDNSKATLCQLIEREDGHIQWTDTSQDIMNRFRALTPWPGIFSFYKDSNSTAITRIKLVSIKALDITPIEKHSEGEVFEIGSDIGVQTAKGVIILEMIQKEGKKAMEAKAFINGNPKFIGSILC